MSRKHLLEPIPQEDKDCTIPDPLDYVKQKHYEDPTVETSGKEDKEKISSLARSIGNGTESTHPGNDSTDPAKTEEKDLIQYLRSKEEIRAETPSVNSRNTTQNNRTRFPLRTPAHQPHAP